MNDELFLAHVRRFLNEHLPGHSRRVAVAVSGGRDSLLLLACAVEWWRRGDLDSVRALVVHHGTRSGQDEDVKFVHDRAARWGVECQVLSLRGPAPTSNVEHDLRKARHGALKAALLDGEDLWMGHHLDDSWEWSQLQAARSGDWRSALGIPLRAGRIVRPFLCVTREQITRRAGRIQLEWREDPTNRDTRFERNWWRQRMAETLQRRHPAYLKHYARRQQALAERLGMACRTSAARIFRHPSGALIQGLPSAQQLTELVATYSGVARGRLGGEVQKVLRAQGNGKRGPFRLVGGVEVHLWEDWLLVVPRGHRFCDADAAGRRQTELPGRNWTLAEFRSLLEERIRSSHAPGQAPFWIKFTLDQKARNRLVPAGRDVAWPETTAPGSGAVMSAFKLLRRWHDPALTLRFTPLFSLE